MSVKIKTGAAGSSRTIEVDEIEFVGAQVARTGRKAKVRIRDRQARQVADEASELALLVL